MKRLGWRRIRRYALWSAVGATRVRRANFVPQGLRSSVEALSAVAAVLQSLRTTCQADNLPSAEQQPPIGEMPPGLNVWGENLKQSRLKGGRG